MKRAFIAVVMTASLMAVAQTVPVITSSPTNVTVYPGNTATFMVAATGATGYQWLFDGTNIAGATSATLQITNAQSTNCGYYLAVVKNSTGWTPSQMAYLTLDYTYGGSQPTACGTLPLSNTNDTYFAGDVDVSTLFGPEFPTNGTVQILAGPELDQMQPVGELVPYRSFDPNNRFYNGYYNAPNQSDSAILPGQTIYYGVVVNFTNAGDPIVFPSTIMNLAAGTNGSPAPSSYGLKFPGWFVSEGVEPVFFTPGPATNQLRVSGETCSITNTYFGYTDYGTPTTQWRKNGQAIPGATNNTAVMDGFSATGPSVLALTNLQASDAGIYDLIIYGNEWVVSPKITLSVQTTDGQGMFQKPTFAGTNFVCNLAGAAGRNYQVQWSTNLTSWNNLVTLSNLTGTVTFTNPASATGAQFYRTVLVSF